MHAESSTSASRHFATQPTESVHGTGAPSMNVLDGLRVIDVSQNIAGPHCTQILGDLGADVIKVEPPSGDPTRAWGPPFWEGESPMFLAFNRNKRSLTLDLKTGAGRDVLCRLVDGADVFVQAFRSGVIDDLGFGWEAVHARNPRAVYASVSGYGSEGPLRERPGYDPLIQAYTGVMSLTGYPDERAARVGGSVVDVGTGILTALGVMAALRERDRTGMGSHVESSLLATSLGWVSYHLQGYLATGVVPERMGSGLAMIAPYEAFATTDGELMVSAGHDGIFQRLCDSLGLGELPGDARFSSNPARVANRAALHELVEARTRGFSTAELRALFDEHRVPSAPIQDVSDVVDDPQIRANGLLEPVPHPRIEGYRDVSFPIRFDGVRPAVRRVPPSQGEHGREVLEEVGYSTEEIAALTASGSVVVPNSDRE
jgi:crotonobetainyl-CoA:carnitine CoA-transferase CaiB-like acyl-CoA transferase